MEEWFFTKDDAQQGPVSSEQIRALVSGGHLDPGSTLVWRDGMSDWKSLKDTELLAAASSSSQLPPPTIAPVTANRNYAPLNQPQQQPVRKGYEVEAQYPGFGRLAYFLINLISTVVLYAIFFFLIFAVFGIGKGSASGVIAIFGSFILLMMFVNLFIAYKRVVNLGMSGVTLFLILVPIVNIWLGWRLIACPAGYEHHRTLDTAGKIITGIILGFFGLAILAGILPAFFVG